MRQSTTDRTGVMQSSVEKAAIIAVGKEVPIYLGVSVSEEVKNAKCRVIEFFLLSISNVCPG